MFVIIIVIRALTSVLIVIQRHIILIQLNFFSHKTYSSLNLKNLLEVHTSTESGSIDELRTVEIVGQINSITLFLSCEIQQNDIFVLLTRVPHIRSGYW